ncbi:MAG: hypothetical protein ACLPVF_04800 [Acidimicrobiales bacterium]
MIAVLVVALGALGLAACQLPFDATGYLQGSGPVGSDLDGASITNQYPDGTATTYVYSGSGTSVSATAPRGENSDERDAYWFSNSPVARDEQSCSTWDASPGHTQQGEVLNVTQNANGVVHGIAVVDNVFGGAKWFFNIYSITGDPDNPIGDIKEGYDLSSVVGGESGPYAALPWHECARTFEGRVQFVVWTGTNPKPAYGTPRAGGSVAIPPGYGGPGRAGWFVGHIDPGETAEVSDLTTTGLDADPLPSGHHDHDVARPAPRHSLLTDPHAAGASSTRERADRRSRH